MTTQQKAGVDVLAVIDAIGDGLHPRLQSGEYATLARARDAVAELIEAASAYFNGYCVDEAGDEITYGEGRHARGCWTGCTREQHEAANRLRAALARFGGAA